MTRRRNVHSGDVSGVAAAGHRSGAREHSRFPGYHPAIEAALPCHLGNCVLCRPGRLLLVP